MIFVFVVVPLLFGVGSGAPDSTTFYMLRLPGHISDIAAPTYTGGFAEFDWHLAATSQLEPPTPVMG